MTYPEVRRQSNERSDFREVSIAELVAEEQKQLQLHELAEQAGWNFTPRRFEKSLSMVVAIPESITGNNVLLGAFQGENCQGIAVASDTEGKRRFFLPVGLNSEEEVLQFKLFNPETGEQLWASNVELFAANNLVGHVDSPYTLTFLEGGDRTPFLGMLNSQELPEDASFEKLNLLEALTNFDQDEVKFEVEGNGELQIEIDNGVLQVTAPYEHWNGAETFTITAVDQTENALTSNSVEVTYTLLAVDDRPEWKGMSAVSGLEDEMSVSINLADYVEEVDGDQLSYAVEVPEQWDFTLEGSMLTAQPQPNWNGSTTFKLLVSDENTDAMLQSEIDLVVAVQAVDDEPILHPIPNQEVNVGESFEPITLNSFLEELDGDQMRWRAIVKDGQTQVKVVVENGQAIVQPIDPNWTGEALLEIKAIDRTPSGKEASQTVSFRINTNLGVSPQAGNGTQLLQNAPNPFADNTAILYQLVESSHTKLVVYDVSGKKVQELIDREQLPGTYLVNWDGRDLGNNIAPSGIYLVVLQTGNQMLQIKVMKE